ncbi:MAG: hypothetical protein A2W26_12185 [Acidobacteria bacterium RBG_16_64_8]|nr:MAG: hypothetical protein A2W26_12185 [Acidobacteria bacterium RBG_16_64_8]
MSGRTVWAVVLIGLGVWFVLDSLDVLGGRGWSLLWPVVIIAIGLALILSRRRSRQPVPTLDALALDGATHCRITIRHGAGRLTVRGGAASELLYSGRFGGSVERTVARFGDVLEVALGASGRDWPYLVVPWTWTKGHPGLEWDILLGAVPALDLVFETGASESHLDMSGLRVERFQVKTAASRTRIIAPTGVGLTRGRISSGAASVDVVVPSGVAAHISGVMGLGALHVDQGRFPKNEKGYYESPGYADAPDRLELEVEGGVGAVTVR